MSVFLCQIMTDVCWFRRKRQKKKCVIAAHSMGSTVRGSNYRMYKRRLMSN